MKTRTPQLQKQSKLKADSLLKQQQHAIVVMTQSPQQQHPKKKAERTEVLSRSQEKNDKTKEGDDEIRRLIEARRNTVKGDKHQLKGLSKRIKKCIRDRKRKTTTGKYSADCGGIQRQTKKWRSTTLKLRYYLRARVRNILGKQLHSSNIACVGECEKSWEKISFQQQDTAEIKKPNQSGLGIVLQIQTRADITIVLLSTPTQSDYSNMVITPTLSYASGTGTL